MRQLRGLTVTILLGFCIAWAAPLDSRQVVDPGDAGPFQASTPTEYTLPQLLLPGLGFGVEFQAVVVGPVGVTTARPLVVFLHGASFTCYTPNPNDPNDHDSGALPGGVYPCPAGTLVTPNHLGYLQSQRLLATQGYLTISIQATGIHGQERGTSFGNDFVTGSIARSNLVRLHLARWSDWSGPGRARAPAFVRNLPPANMASVLLVGHSRGGEGVNRAVIDTLQPPPPEADHMDLEGTPANWTIVGQLLIAPQLNGHNPAPDTPSISILPGCDRDITQLEGELWVDSTRSVNNNAALHASVFVEFANHNFFNSEWRRDGSNNPNCAVGAPNRLSRAAQLNVGATYAAAAARLFINRDPVVLPLVDGSPVPPPPSTSPARIHTHAIGANRRELFLPGPLSRASGGAQICEIVPGPSTPNPCQFSNSPHATLFGGARPDPGRLAVRLPWTSPGTAGVMSTLADLNGFEQIALRVVVPIASTGTSMEVAIADGSDRRVVLGNFTLNGFPNGDGAAELSQEVRVSLAGATQAGLDLGVVNRLELVPLSQSGTAWLMDAWGWRNGMPDPRIVTLPRVDVPEVLVPEGDGNSTNTVTIPFRGSGGGQIRFLVVDPARQPPTISSQLVNFISAGQATFDVQVPLIGDDSPFTQNRTVFVLARAVRNVFVGDAFGGLQVVEDDF